MYMHGIQSHGGWFEWSASLLARTGSPVLLPDRRGSGRNEAERGDTPSADRWLADIDELAEWVTREVGVRRLAGVGVSWGGKLAVAWALRRPARVERLLLVAPGLFPAVGVGIIGRVRIGAALLGQPGRRFPIPLDDPALFTSDPAGQSLIAHDPLKLTSATARFFYQSSRLDRQLMRCAPGRLQPTTTLILAGRDRIIRNERTERWLRRVAATPPTVQYFAEADHTLEFETDPGEFEQAVQDWANSAP
ncbi:MAG: lysophospholipase [Planctomycetes bacterium]|nr:lysophospholipase [Planctomycetota bacterium]